MERNIIMEASWEFWVQILIYAVSFAATFGSVLSRLKHLEKKMDRHNNAMERLAKLEIQVKVVESKASLHDAEFKFMKQCFVERSKK